jgi:hypothetical protein
MNRFDLEDAMSALYNMGDDIDAILHSYMDAKVRPTEDDMANMLIGAKALHNARYQRMWEIFEDLVKNGTISNKSVDKVDLPNHNNQTTTINPLDEYIIDGDDGE